MLVGDLFTALKTANSGLLAQQQALDVTANNVANVQTPGFSRRLVSFQTHVISGEGRGVKLATLQRSIDEGLVRSLRGELARLNAAKAHVRYDQQIQNQFGSVDSSNSLAAAFASLQAAFETLASSAESSLNQKEVIAQAESTTAQLRQLSTTTQNLRATADQEIAAAVTEVGTLLKRIADFNNRIVRANETGQSAVDALDARDQALNRLSELMDVKIYARPRGDVVVFTASGRTLVDDQAATLTHRPASSVTAGVHYASGGFDAITLTIAGRSVDITSEIGGGELKGLLDLRDRRLVDLQACLDTLAAGLCDSVNALHNQGTAWPGASQLSGSRPIVNPAAESLTYGGSADTAIIVFDAAGNEVRRTTVRTLLGGAATGTVEQIQQAIDGWLAPDGYARFDDNGRLTLAMTTPELGIGLLDVASDAPGAPAAPAPLTHSVDTGDLSGVPRVIGAVEGFSAFFGLNDLFVGGGQPNAYASQLFVSGYRTAAPANVKLVDAAGVMPDALGLPSDITVPAGASLADIAQLFSAIPGILASVVSEGGGERLVVTSADGRTFRLVDDTAAGNRLVSDLGLGVSASGTATALAVRSDLSRSPSLLASGQPTWQADEALGGRYSVSVGEASIARDLADALAAPAGLPWSGAMAAVTLSLSDYAAAIIGAHSTDAARFAEEAEYETYLVDSLTAQSQSVSGVNLDEEMANLIVYEEAYSAAANIITTIQAMFDALERAVAS
jgi:flagellar hook-associated protein 1 FlgK